MRKSYSLTISNNIHVNLCQSHLSVIIQPLFEQLQQVIPLACAYGGPIRVSRCYIRTHMKLSDS